MEWENLQLAESDFSWAGWEMSTGWKAVKANVLVIILSNY